MTCNCTAKHQHTLSGHCINIATAENGLCDVCTVDWTIGGLCAPPEKPAEPVKPLEPLVPIADRDKDAAIEQTAETDLGI